MTGASPAVDEDTLADMCRMVERFGRRSAALYLLLGRLVPTPEGQGELVQVLGPRSRVAVGDRLISVRSRELFAWATGGTEGATAGSESGGAAARAFAGGGAG